MPGLPCLQCFLTGACAARAALLGPVSWFYARSLALCVGQRFSAPNPRYGEARRRALCRGLASASKVRGSLDRSPAASGGVAAATRVVFFAGVFQAAGPNRCPANWLWP